MNKTSVIIFSLLLLLFLGCSSRQGSDSLVRENLINRGLDSIVSKGELRALINYSATSYFLYKGLPMGFEYELLQKYTKHIGVDLVLIPIKNRDSVFVDLNNGIGDIVAGNFTITHERLQWVDFTVPVLTTKQVLVQRKEKGALLQTPFDLIGKTVVVRKGSSFYSRLQNLSNEIGGKIYISAVAGDVSMEELIGLVASGDIDYTVADQNIARVNQWRYPNIDASMVISLDQRIGWSTRKNERKLTLSINEWLTAYQKTKSFKVLYQKYFKSQRMFNKRIKHEYYTLVSGHISAYDKMFKTYAPSIGWDWELLAAMVYQESNFNNKARGWGGSFGLMQFMPETGANYGVDTNSTPRENISAGVKYLKRLGQIWTPHIKDAEECKKFILASYNVGPGHVIDARNLAKKYNKNPDLWKDVSYFLLHKSEPKYYKDEVVKHGYCKGYIVYAYVNEIMERYQHYLQVGKEEANQVAFLSK